MNTRRNILDLPIGNWNTESRRCFFITRFNHSPNTFSIGKRFVFVAAVKIHRRWRILVRFVDRVNSLLYRAEIFYINNEQRRFGIFLNFNFNPRTEAFAFKREFSWMGRATHFSPSTPCQHFFPSRIFSTRSSTRFTVDQFIWQPTFTEQTRVIPTTFLSSKIKPLPYSRKNIDWIIRLLEIIRDLICVRHEIFIFFFQ